MPISLNFDACARLPLPGDNVAIVTRRLEKDTRIQLEDRQVTLASTLMEGHRFALTSIADGMPLLSWGLPFGVAVKDIEAGDTSVTLESWKHWVFVCLTSNFPRSRTSRIGSSHTR